MFKQILDLPNDSTQKTFAIATLLCLVCSIIVSGAAVGLKSLQQSNKTLDIKRNILEVAGLMEEGIDIESAFSNIEAKVVDVRTGDYVEDIDSETYDQRKAASDTAQNIELDGDSDVAKIKRQAKYAKIYHVKENDQLKLIILPVHGYGLWSTMYGFLALESDGNTVYGLKFYEHGETPGLGGEIDNPKWRTLWDGKLIYGEEYGEPMIRVVRGKADPNGQKYQHQIDGLAGATLTSQGVDKLMQFWLGKNGFGPYLEKLRSRNS